MDHRPLRQRLRLVIVCGILLTFACGTVTSSQRAVSPHVVESPGFVSLDEPTSPETKTPPDRERWEGAATAVLFVLVVLGSAALPILLLL